ncbi:MAG: carbohydrate ABC transporter permease [Alphaproteobacteria bacterium]|nr:carbohydrate ABC transporter permease [Alphaproteobacteria bacterium]
MSGPAARRFGVLLGTLLILAWSLGPIVWMGIGSVTPEVKPDLSKPWSSARGVEYFPSEPTLQNYRDLFETVKFGTYFLNSVVVATGTMVLALAVASLGAYGFVRFRFVGRAPLLTATLMAYMIPSVVLMVPLLVILRRYGLVNTYPGLILAEATNTAPFVLLLMINYFSSLPRELEEAAQVDGCGRLATLIRIVLPLAVPGLVAGGLFAFIATWNNFLFAFLLSTSDATKTLPVIMRLFALGEPAVWGVSAAGALLTMLPVAALFLVFQRALISGLAAGAVKG